MMKQMILALTVLVLVLPAVPAAAGTPAAVVPSPLYEFEPVPDGEHIFHDFIIKNTGTADLKISRVKTG